jgi:hypothetical protein
MTTPQEQALARLLADLYIQLEASRHEIDLLRAELTEKEEGETETETKP